MNCDFKLVEGVEARRFRKISNRVLSPVQYVAGKDRRIHHGIAKARDAIQAAMKSKFGCGIADTDFVAAFDWLVLSWVWKVLIKLGVNERCVHRVKELYQDSITIVSVNNKLGRVFQDKRESLRQLFAFGIDPLLRYLDMRLQGILITSIPIMGPVLQGQKMKDSNLWLTVTMLSPVLPVCQSLSL